MKGGMYIPPFIVFSAFTSFGVSNYDNAELLCSAQKTGSTRNTVQETEILKGVGDAPPPPPSKFRTLYTQNGRA